MKKRAEILVSGKVQGVGFRNFILNIAMELGLKGYTQNLISGEVKTIVEGELEIIQNLYENIQKGPRFSRVDFHSIQVFDSKDEFKNFEIRR